MILSESRTADWIRDAAAKNGAADIGLVEKTIRAFSLLEALVNADCPLVFKGGSSLLLHFSEGHGRRLSVDLDIMCPALFTLPGILEKAQEQMLPRPLILRRAFMQV